MRVIHADNPGTHIPARRKVSPMKRWLAAGVQETRGQIEINAGLTEKLKKNTHTLSILPVGITAVLSGFEKGDVVEIIDENGIKRGHGMARYDSETLETYIGQHNQPIFIHYNALHVDEPDDE
jgi:glutamate 5-kinase